MSKISKNSHECGKSELNLMFTPPTQAMITGGYYVDIYPLNNIDNNTPIEFEIKGSKDEYSQTSFIRTSFNPEFDLIRTYLKIMQSLNEC